jgi:hypothetical protein
VRREQPDWYEVKVLARAPTGISPIEKQSKSGQRS